MTITAGSDAIVFSALSETDLIDKISSGLDHKGSGSLEVILREVAQEGVCLVCELTVIVYIVQSGADGIPVHQPHAGHGV